MARLDALLEQLAEPLHDRLAVMPMWVRQQLDDLVGLNGAPERIERHGKLTPDILRRWPYVMRIQVRVAQPLFRPGG
jgi:hypothetical protein